MNKKHIILIFSIILWAVMLLIGLLPFPQHPFRADGINKIDMTDKMSVYIDAKGDITLDQAKGLNFTDYIKSGVSGSLSDNVYWIKIKLPEHAITEAQAKMWLLEIAKPQLDSIQYYQLDSNGQILNQGELGRKYPFSQRIVQYPNFVLPLEVYHGASTMYLAIKTQSYLQVPATLWKVAAFYKATAEEQLTKGLFYGALLIMIFYNAMLGLAVKDKVYFYYLGCLLSYTLLQCVWDGYSFQYIWPNASKWDLLANPFFINTSVLCFLIFTKKFLKINAKHKKLNKAYKFVLFGTCLSIIGVFILPTHISVYISMGFSAIGIILCFWSLFANGLNSRPAKIYMVALQILFAGNVLNILAGMKLYPYTIITMNAPKVGLLALLTLFSLALADRINQMEYQRRLDMSASQIDGLTQVYNRTYFFKEAEKIVDHSGELNALAVLMIDIDNFKNINDTYGHQQGDNVLQICIPKLKETLGQHGVIGRYGGDEFIVLIQVPNKEAVVKAAENLRNAVKEINISVINEPHSFIMVTISIGVAFKEHTTESLYNLIEKADKALYLAKERGRDQFAID